MFPHIAGKGRISLNRELLDAFFQSAERALAPGGSIEVGLVKGQGGTPADEDKRRALGNTWQIQARAAGGGLRPRRRRALRRGVVGGVGVPVSRPLALGEERGRGRVRGGRRSEARSIHWFPYDSVGVVNADP